jgi:hypothetical protein
LLNSLDQEPLPELRKVVLGEFKGFSHSPRELGAGPLTACAPKDPGKMGGVHIGDPSDGTNAQTPVVEQCRKLLWKPAIRSWVRDSASIAIQTVETDRG